MRTPVKIPPGVNPQAAALLVRAYALQTDDESRALYRDWAETYDNTMLQGLNYQSPALVAGLLAQHLPDRQAQILDIGCGTGLGGQALAEHGFQCIDGLDVSPEMMKVAGRRGVYRQFLTADLNAPLPLANSSQDAMSCCGTFTHGHVDAKCLTSCFGFCAQARRLLLPSNSKSGSRWASRTNSPHCSTRVRSPRALFASTGTTVHRQRQTVFSVSTGVPEARC